ENGELKVEGLPWGKYWFIESKAPAGYGYEADPVTMEQRAYGFDVPTADGAFEIPVNVIDPPAPGVTPTPTRRPTDEPEETPTPTPTDEPTPTPGVTDTPIPTEVVVVVVTETPTSTPTPTTGVTATPTPTRAVAAAAVTPTPTAAVLGARRTKPGDVVSGVLGVRSAPTEGVLGARIGPTTGDAANIALWLIILAASIGAIVLILAQNSKRKKNVK
ncbi:MAG: hypothetical protein IJ873_04765, partial [Lachnospiraceae bacterium]|nr:hypothetical protein [Lachnospiraceae bacterium]